MFNHLFADFFVIILITAVSVLYSDLKPIYPWNCEINHVRIRNWCPVDFPAQPKRLNIKKRRGCVTNRGNRYLARMRLSWPEAQRETNGTILTFSEAAFGKRLLRVIKKNYQSQFPANWRHDLDHTGDRVKA